MINGPTLSLVASLCLTCEPSQYGNFFDFLYREREKFIINNYSSICNSSIWYTNAQQDGTYQQRQ